MPKIKDFIYRIGEDRRNVKVTCNKDGEFSILLPENIHRELNLGPKMSNKNLSALESDFLRVVKQYVAAERSESVHILIIHEATGKYCVGDDGINFMDSTHVAFMTRDALMFEFKVAIKETIGGVDNWFDAKKGSRFASYEEEYKSPEKYFKGHHIYGGEIDRWKKIPFSESALKTLEGARDKLRDASLILHTFLSKDETVIESILNNQKLLI